MINEVFDEKNLTFVFPQGWDVLEFDKCNFHKNHWSQFAHESKAVDFILKEEGSTEVWLLEVTDYRHPESTTPSPQELLKEFATKIRNSIAGLKVLATCGNESPEKDSAILILRGCSSFRLVLHLEQNPRRPIIDPKTVHKLIKQSKLKIVDPRTLIGDTQILTAKVSWSAATNRRTQ